MDAWVKVKTQHHFGDRLAIAEIDRVDWVNSGMAADKFMNLLLLKEFSEDFVRSLLAKLYGDISNWVLIQVHFDLRRMCFKVLVSSADFEKSAMNTELPLIERPGIA